MTRRAAPIVVLVALAAGCGDGAVQIELSASPDRQWYRTGEPVAIEAQVTDDSGKLVEGAHVKWRVDPEGAATLAVYESGPRRTFNLARQGHVIITGCAGSACDTISLQVDDGSPVLEIESPRPGAELDDPAGIVVRGSVSDSSQSRVFVADQLVDVDDLGRFEATLPASFGANHLAVSASDGITEPSSVEMDVLWAPAYAAATSAGGTPDIDLGGGISLSLGQKLFDAETALDTGTSPVVTDDLADILALVAERMPLVERIPDPVIDQSGFFLRIPAADPGPAESSIDVTDDGIEVFVRLSQVTLTTEGTLDFGGKTLDLAGQVVASVAAAARVHASKDGIDGPIDVQLDSLLLALETVDGQFDSAETDAVFLLAEGALRTTIEDQLLGGVREALSDALPAVLSELLSGLDSGLANREFVLDEPLLPHPITFQIDGHLESVTEHRGVELVAGLHTRLGTTSPSVHPESRGVALLAPAAEAPPFIRGRALQVGVRLAFLNGLLHALWSSGALEIDLTDRLTEGLGDLVSGGRLSGKMAPVARPPRAGETDPLILSLGQVEVDLDLPDGSQARFGVSLETGIDADIVDNALVVEAPGEPRVRVWTIEAASNSVINEQLIAAVLEIQWRQIRDAITSGLQFALPVPDLSSLGDLAPDLANLSLSVFLAEPAAVRQDTVMLGGVLQGMLP